SRPEVLSFYKQVIRLSKAWKAKNELKTSEERIYIRTEAKRLIDGNKHLTEDKEIRKCIADGMRRLQVAQHYGIPYPRPIYYPTGAYLRKQK
ncbi:unnamed protein product, partial [Medioppia subpectinata]